MATDPILVVIFLRGGCDGLNLVGPSADETYRTERRTECRVERDGDMPGLILKNSLADVDFRLHYKAQGLKDLYDTNQLAFIHAAGLTNGTRSHFDAQDYIERGTPDNKSTGTGWLTRLAATQPMNGTLTTVSLQNTIPVSLLACPQATAVPNIRKLQISGDGHFANARDALLMNAYQGNGSIMQNGAHVLTLLRNFHPPLDTKGKLVDYVPAANVQYPDSARELSDPLKTLAQLIKMDVGIRIATIDYGGWDTHIGQGGRFANLTDGLSRSLSAFWADMTNYQDRITIVAMSEFGRRLKSNDSGGTDHGHGGVMIAMGAGVTGGNIYGKWPGLKTEELDNQVDLAVTTDFRTVLSEILHTRMNLDSLISIFPQFANYQPLGFMR